MTDMKRFTHGRGDIVLVTSGEYDDFGVRALIKVKKCFDIDQMLKDFYHHPHVQIADSHCDKYPEMTPAQAVDACVANGDYWHLSRSMEMEEQFIAFLVKRGIVEFLAHERLHGDLIEGPARGYHRAQMSGSNAQQESQQQ